MSWSLVQYTNAHDQINILYVATNYFIIVGTPFLPSIYPFLWPSLHKNLKKKEKNKKKEKLQKKEKNTKTLKKIEKDKRIIEGKSGKKEFIRVLEL